MLLLQTGTQIANNSTNNLTSIGNQWTLIWLDTFNNPNPTQSIYFYIVNIAKIIAAFGAFFMLLKVYNYSKKIDDPTQAATAIATLAFMSMLFYNDCYLTGQLAFGIRTQSNIWQREILKTQVNSVSFNTAINNNFLTQQARQVLTNIKAQCDAITVPPNVRVVSVTRPTNPNPPLTAGQIKYYDKSECYESLARKAQEIAQKSSTINCGPQGLTQYCQGLISWAQQYATAFQQGIAKNQAQVLSQGQVQKDYVDEAFKNWLAGAGNPALQELLQSLQFAFLQMMEAGQWLAGVVGPFSIVFSLFPNNGMPLFLQWILIQLGIALSKIFYILLVGVSAQSLSQVTASGFYDSAFGLILGVLAPGIALAVGTGGIIAAINSMAGTSLAVVQGAIGIGAAVVGGAAGLLR